MSCETSGNTVMNDSNLAWWSDEAFLRKVAAKKLCRRYSTEFRSSRQEVFYNKGVLRNFAKFQWVLYTALTSYVSAYNFHFTLFHEITYLATLTLLKSNICLSTSERKPIPFVETQTVYNWAMYAGKLFPTTWPYSSYIHTFL